MTERTKDRPRIGCAVIVRDDDGQVLLGRRAKEPYFGAWVLPGGGVTQFESYFDTAKREAKEELGIDVAVDGIYQVAEIINPPTEHRIVLYVNCKMVAGDLRPASDISEARFFGKAQVKRLIRDKLTTPTVSNILCSLFGLQEASWLQHKARSAA